MTAIMQLVEENVLWLF